MQLILIIVPNAERTFDFSAFRPFATCRMVDGWVVVAMLLDLVMEDDDIVRRRDTMKTPTPTSSPLSLFQRVRTETRSVREL